LFWKSLPFHSYHIPMPSQLVTSNVFHYCGVNLHDFSNSHFLFVLFLIFLLIFRNPSVVTSMFSDLFFSGHISLLYVTMLFMMVLYILFLLSFEMPWSHNTLFNTEIAFLPCVHLSLMVLSIVPSLVMLIPRS
jgi:hypothetical protein